MRLAFQKKKKKKGKDKFTVMSGRFNGNRFECWGQGDDVWLIISGICRVAPAFEYLDGD